MLAGSSKPPRKMVKSNGMEDKPIVHVLVFSPFFYLSLISLFRQVKLNRCSTSEQLIGIEVEWRYCGNLREDASMVLYRSYPRDERANIAT
jgi:hypothetical protein